MTVTQLFPVDMAEDEATRLRLDLETYRAYLAGPCDEYCKERHGYTDEELVKGYDGHRHWTNWYEAHRSLVVALNGILGGNFDREFCAATTATIDTDEL